MLTLFHSPMTRSTGITALIAELGIADRITVQLVNTRRMDGTGARDAANPHPEGKVPVLVHDGRVITERGAIILHLCAMFPEAGLAPAPGTAAWGAFAAWIVWYHGVMEPVLMFRVAGLAHPVLQANFRDIAAATERLSAALSRGSYLLGDHFSAADLLVHSPFAWKPELTPDDPLIRDWVTRCAGRPALRGAWATDAS
jgi:glutathione S-transferase